MKQTFYLFLDKLSNFTLDRLLPVLIILVLGILCIRLVMKLIGSALSKTKLETAPAKLIKALLRIVLYVLLALVCASKLGVDVTGVVALASVLTLAISLSVQNALTNIISGFSLLYTKPFVAGDFVEIAGQSGSVTDVGLTYTKLSTGDNKIISIPNSAVTTAQIVNYSASGTRRVDVSISAAYTTPVEDVLAALRIAGSADTILDSPAPFAAIKEYGDSSIRYILQVWCKSEDYWTTLFEINKNIKTVFDEKGIAMTYPHINVHLDK